MNNHSNTATGGPTKGEIDLARQIAEKVSVQAAWGYLATLGWSYAETAQAVTTGGNVLSDIAQAYTSARLGMDVEDEEFREIWGDLADEVFEQNMIQLEDTRKTGLGWGTSKHREKAYFEATKNVNLPPDVAVDSIFSKANYELRPEINFSWYQGPIEEIDYSSDTYKDIEIDMDILSDLAEAVFGAYEKAEKRESDKARVDNLLREGYTKEEIMDMFPGLDSPELLGEELPSGVFADALGRPVAVPEPDEILGPFITFLETIQFGVPETENKKKKTEFPLGAIKPPLAGEEDASGKKSNELDDFSSAIGGPIGIGDVAAARARREAAAKLGRTVDMKTRIARIRKVIDIERRTEKLKVAQAKRRAALAKASDGTEESRPSTPVTRTSPIGGPIGYGEEAAFKARQEALAELAAQVQANKNEANKTASAKAGPKGRSLLDATGSTPGQRGGGGRDAPATSLLDGSAAPNTARTGLLDERDRNKGGPGQGGSYGGGGDKFDPSSRFHSGGLVSDGDPSTFVSGLPVILQEGEFILSRAAVDALGAKTLERLNAVGWRGKAAAEPIRAALTDTLGGGGPKSDRQLNDLLADRRYTRLGFPGQAAFAGRVAREFKLAYPGDAEGRPIGAEGGLVTDNDAATRRDDYATQAAEGTFVIARKAVDALGLNALARLNAAAIAGDRAALARLRHAFSELMA